MRRRILARYLWGFVSENPTQGQKQEPAMKREEDHKGKNEEISGTGSTSLHSLGLNSRIENQKQPCQCSCQIKNQKETLVPGAMVPFMKKEPVKRENQYNKEIRGSPNTSNRYFPDSSIFETRYFDIFSDIIKNASLSGEATVPMKRKIPEAEENREGSVDSTLYLGYQRKNKKRRTDEGVSTKLKLFDVTWPTENREPYTKELSEADIKEREVACRIAAMKNYRPGEVEEEKGKGVSTKLELYLDPWIIKKKLTRSDLNHLSRLLLKTSLIEKHVLPLMDFNIVNDVKKEKGLNVTVCDQDTDSLHRLVFKKWHSCQSYILNGRWVQDFVIRRNLKEGHEIGMYWDQNYSRFNFCVLNRAPTIHPTAANGTSSSTKKNSC